MSAISNLATAQVFQQEGGGFLLILTINHADLAAPIRVVNNTQNVTSNALEYIAFPFEVTLPRSAEGVPPRAQLVIDNVSREIGQLIRQVVGPPTVTFSLIRIDDLNAVEVTFPVFNLRNVEYDVFTVTGDLTVDNITQEPFPQRTFSPAEYPALFVG